MQLPLPLSGADSLRFWRVEGHRAEIVFWVLLLSLTGLRFALAATLGLTPDEAYYWMWSRHLQPGYLDHPPLIALWIRAGTEVFGENALGIRALGPLSALIGSVALIRAGQDLFGSRAAGYRAALLLNATLMLGLGSAIATPDTPLVFFLAWALWAIGRLVATRRPIWWLGIGGLFGLAFDSKYTAVLPALGCGIWFLLTAEQRRHWRFVLAGSLTGLVCAAPVIYWNASHHWASFAKQGGRVGDWQPLRALNFLTELVGGQIGLATPLIFFLFTLGIIWCFRYARSNPIARMLACLSVVPIIVFVQHAFGGRVQANWPVVLYPTASLAAAAIKRRVGLACGFGLTLTGLVIIQGIFSPIPLSARYDVIARQSADWDGFARRVRQNLPDMTPLIVGHYALAAMIAYQDPTIRLYSVDTRWFYLGRKKESVRSAMLLLRDGERPDLPLAGLGVTDSQRVCRSPRDEPFICYRLVAVNPSIEDKTYRLP